jgi:hypothetical protein
MLSPLMEPQTAARRILESNRPVIYFSLHDRVMDLVGRLLPFWLVDPWIYRLQSKFLKRASLSKQSRP